MEATPESWETAARLFWRTVAKAEWVSRLEQTLASARQSPLPQGHIPGNSCALDRQWRTFIFDTSFDGLPAATETVTFARQKPDADWKAIGYLIKPAVEGTAESGFRDQQANVFNTQAETTVLTPGASDDPAPSPVSLPKVSPCSISTPEHLHTLPGRLLYNFQAKGECLRLDRDTLSFDSGWSVVRIPLLSIQALGLGNFPVSVFKRMPTNYLAVTFSEHGVSRTLLLTPTVRATSVRTWVNSRFEPSKTIEICKLVMQWLFALRGAIQASTGRTLPVGHADAKIPSRWARAKARLLAAAVFAIPFAMILRLSKVGCRTPTASCCRHPSPTRMPSSTHSPASSALPCGLSSTSLPGDCSWPSSGVGQESS